MKKTLFLLIILCFSSSFSISTFDKSVSRIKSLYQYAVNHKKISLALGSSLIVGLGALKFFHFRKVKKTKEETLKKKFEEEKQLSEIIQSLEPKIDTSLKLKTAHNELFPKNDSKNIVLIDKKHNKIDIKAMTKNQKRAYLLKLWINREISYNKKSKILLHWHMWIYSQAIFCECKKNELDIQEIKRVAFILIDKIILFLYKVKNKQYDPQELLLYFENTLNSSLGRVPQIFIIM